MYKSAKKLLALTLAAACILSASLLLTACSSAEAPMETLAITEPKEMDVTQGPQKANRNQGSTAEDAKERIQNGIEEIDSREAFDILHTYSSQGNPNDYRRYLKKGENHMVVAYTQGEGQPIPSNGSMVRDGIKYFLSHENLNTNDSPIWGWEPRLNLPEGVNPRSWKPLLEDLDQGTYTEVTDEKILCHMDIPAEPGAPDDHEKLQDGYRDTVFHFDAEGKLTAVRITTVEYHWNSHMEQDEYKYYWDMEVLDSSGVSQVFADQKEAPLRPFSWEEDKNTMKAENAEFQNTDKQDVADAAQALNRAKAEVTTEFDGTVVYYDPDAMIWKVEFQHGYGWQGYTYVYLDIDGITQMVSTAGPKEQWYPEQ